MFWGPRDKAPSSVWVSVATASLETRATHMLGCSGRGGRGGTAASTAGSSSRAGATARQAALASARTSIVRAIALPLGPLLADSQATFGAARPGLHARHALEDSGTPQPSRTRCGARGRRRCGWCRCPERRELCALQTLARSAGVRTRSGMPQTSDPPAARPPPGPQPPPRPSSRPFSAPPPDQATPVPPSAPPRPSQ